MATAPGRRASPGRRPGLAAVWWTVGVVVLLLTPLAQRVDPEPDGGPRAGAVALAWGAVWVTVQAVAVARASAAPRTALVVAAAVVPLAAWTSVVSAAVPAVLVTVYLLVVRSVPARRWSSPPWPDLVLAWALCVAGGLVDGARSGQGSVTALVATTQAVVVVGVPAAVAAAVRSRRELRRARERELVALERERDATARAAVVAERTAMARELHDIAAHHLSGIALMASAIEAQARTDPAAAGRSARQVRQQAVDVVRDLRQVVGLLRPDDDGGAPSRSLADLGDLVGEVRAVGLDVGLDVLRATSPDDVPALGHGLGPLAQLAVYRTVQEALSNATRHAPGASCTVTVDDRAADALLVTVRNDRPAVVPAETRGSGVGLVGMRERAALVGGALEVGPTDDGGWSVALRVPREMSRETGDDG